MAAPLLVNVDIVNATPTLISGALATAITAIGRTSGAFFVSGLGRQVIIAGISQT